MTFEYPTDPSQSPKPAEDLPSGQELPSQGVTLRILLVEDDPDARANLCDILELDGHQFVPVGTIAAAVAALETEPVSAIILDRQLPDGDAQNAIPTLAQLAPNAPIVVVTGLPDIESAISALRSGAYDYILKPISPDVLRASLRRIAERRETIDELRRQRDFAESLIETAQSIVLVLDANAKIVRFNSFMAELCGYSLDDVQGADWFETFVPAPFHSATAAIFLRAVQGERIHEHVNPIRTRDGEERQVSWWATAIRDENGHITGVLSVGHDVTALRKAEERIVQSERLAAIGQMVTGLAHESRNAFQRSQACLDMLALEVGDRPEAGALVEKIQKALDHLHHLYEEVRDYAAPIQLSRHETDLGDLWRETWAHLELVRHGKDVRLYERNVGIDLVCAVDRHAFEQVFRNVLENAIAACLEPGEITITCNATRLDGRPAVELQVSDNGPGIKLGMRDQIFDPFFTTKTKGTGLGLAIVKRLIVAHGGTIEVDDSPSGGALMVIRVPRKAPPITDTIA